MAANSLLPSGARRLFLSLHLPIGFRYRFLPMDVVLGGAGLQPCIIVTLICGFSR